MQILTSSSLPAVVVQNRNEWMQCSLVILRNGDTELLVCEGSSGYRLPIMRVPARQRLAPTLLHEIEQQLGLRAFGRFSFRPGQGSPGERCLVADAVESCGPHPPDHRWLPVSSIRWDDFARDAGAYLWSALAKVNAYATGKLAGRFVQAGWFSEVRDWTAACLDASGLKLSGLASQLNLGPDFALLRFASSGPAVWFKAVGPENAREFATTRILSDAGVPHIPELLGAHESWMAWLSVEAEGKHPDGDSSVLEWVSIARCLAELQIASVPHTAGLLAAGCRDLCADRLREAITPCLSRLVALMALQPATPPRRLDAEDFRLIDARLRQACRQLERLGIADALGQSDFNNGNILVNGDDAVFLDWAESHIGPPFLTLAYLELLPDSAQARLHARKAYLDRWAQECPSAQIESLRTISPLLAVFAYVLVCDDPERNPEPLNSERAGFLRSLARRMHAEAEHLQASRG